MRVAASSDRVTRDAMSTPVEPPTFEVIELRETARVRLRLRGELDLATADVLADRLRSLRERNATVLLDRVRRLFDLLDLDEHLPLDAPARPRRP